MTLRAERRNEARSAGRGWAQKWRNNSDLERRRMKPRLMTRLARPHAPAFEQSIIRVLVIAGRELKLHATKGWRSYRATS